MNPVLEVHDVHKSFAAVRAVRGLSFEVRPGEIFALLGPNGAGKTTLVRMLLAILRPDRGRIEWNLAGGASERGQRLGYLPEERGLHRDVPVLRTLTYFGMLRGLGRAAAREAGRTWLDRLELLDRAGDKIDTLSKGNQQKVQFAAAVLHRPDFAVLDEPFSGFDPVNQERFLDHMRRMRDEGMTILLSAHQMQLVERIADRILVVAGGREVLSGSLDEVRAQVGAGRRLTLDVLGDPDLEALGACAGVRSVQRDGEGRLQLDLADSESLNATLGEVMRHVTIRSVHDQARALHDIYLEAVEAPATPPLATDEGATT